VHVLRDALVVDGIESNSSHLVYPLITIQVLLHLGSIFSQDIGATGTMNGADLTTDGVAYVDFGVMEAKGPGPAD
jgi:hypothetical protein